MFLYKRTGIRLKMKLGRLTSWVLVVELHSEGAGRSHRRVKTRLKESLLGAVSRVGLGLCSPHGFGAPEQPGCGPEPCPEH